MTKRPEHAIGDERVPVDDMTSVLTYVLAILLVPMAIALMLLMMGRLEAKPPHTPPPRLPHLH